MDTARTVMVSETEAWLLDECIRHTAVDGGQPVGKQLLLKVFSLLGEFRDRAAQPYPPTELPMAVTEAEAWAIDYHFNAARLQRADPATIKAARDLLLKVFNVILEFQSRSEMTAGAATAKSAEDDRSRERLQEWRRLMQGDEADRPEPTGESAE